MNSMILEGGAFRGVYTSGVLDVLAENGVGFDAVVGVSAGALNGINFISGQIGRSARINLCYVRDSRYVGPRALLRSHSVIGFDFLFGEVSDELDPFDNETFFSSPTKFYAVATNCLNGKPAFFERDHSDILLAARASASMPLLSRFVQIDGVPYLDGGIACAIPYQWALDAGHEKIVLVLTRQKGYRKEPLSYKMKELYYRTYRKYPALMRQLLSAQQRYNRMQEEIEELEAAGRIFVLRPQKPVAVSRLERNVDKLEQLYSEGRLETLQRLEELKWYLQV